MLLAAENLIIFDVFKFITLAIFDNFYFGNLYIANNSKFLFPVRLSS
jgi:hypothetical protein